MISKDEVVKIGRLQKSYGIKGEITLTFDKSAYAGIETQFYLLDIEGIFVPFFIEEITFITDTGARVKFEDIDNESKASRFTNLNVFLPSKQLSSRIDESATDWDFFIGYSVFDQYFRDLGLIERVDDATLNVLFIVKKAEIEHLIPAAQDFISEIDAEKKIIRMNLPDGLIGIGQE